MCELCKVGLRDPVVKREIACDPDASNGRVRDLPARPKMEKNAVINKREEHPPPRASDQISAKVDKSNYDPAVAAAHDAQAPDPPVRPMVEKNVTSKGREVLPPEQPERRRGLSDLKDMSETSEEQRAEAVLQGGPDAPTQKLPSVIKPAA